MKTNLKIDGTMVLTGAAIIAAVGVTYLVKKKGAAIAGVVTQGLNPASTENYAYKGINRMGEVFTGDFDWNLGVAAYEVLNVDIPSLFSGGFGATAPGLSVQNSDGKTIAAASGSDLKKYNANPTNMGGIGSFPSTSNWYDGLGYSMTAAEDDNPFYYNEPAKAVEKAPPPGISPLIIFSPIAAIADTFSKGLDWWNQ